MRRIVSVVASIISLIVWAAPGLAQQYPQRTVTVIVPYPAGGPTDQLARMLAPVLPDKLGQNVIVENVSGGATTIATGRVARAMDPEGQPASRGLDAVGHQGVARRGADSLAHPIGHAHRKECAGRGQGGNSRLAPAPRISRWPALLPCEQGRPH